MDFFSSFRLQNAKDKMSQDAQVTEIKRLVTQIMPSAPKPHFHMPLRGYSSKKKLSFECLHEIPLSERMTRFVDTGLYQRAYCDMLDKTIREIKEQAIKDVKPELLGKISLKSVQFDTDALKSLQDSFAGCFLDAVFCEGETETAYSHLQDLKAPLTKTDIDVLKVCIFVRKHNPHFLYKKYGIRKGIFQSMIARKATDLLDLIGEVFILDPRIILSYGIESCRGIEGYDRGEMAMTADRWMARWLTPKMMKPLVQAKPLLPIVGTKTEKPIPEDFRRTLRYQDSFKRSLLYYFYNSPTAAQNVFQVILSHMAKTDLYMQEQMWGILFQKYRTDPTIRDAVVGHMSSFLEQNAPLEAQKTMYGMFVKVLPPEKRADILGHMPFRTLKRYWNTFRKISKNMPYVALHSDNESTHMAWVMFRERELTDEQMKGILEKSDPRTQRAFLFSPKKQMDSDLFLHMCDKFAHSPFYFWQWVRSFRSTNDLKGTLAKIYLTLPESVKGNGPYVAAMNHHFDLIRECAIAGDTASLSALKKVVGSNIFWDSLLQESEEKISGVRALCRHGKRGLLKLISDWPKPKQQALFRTPGANGRTLLDECTSNLARLVVQDVFNQVYPKEIIEESVTQTPAQPIKKAEDPSEKPQKRPQRQIIRIPVFETHMAKIAINTKLVKEVEDAIETLSKMSKTEISAELREGWKNHGSLQKAPCAVKDIRGNNYRLGYLLRGDIDQGTGQIAFLFFLTHAQYNIFLNRQADQAVKTAKAMMLVAQPSPFGPSGPMGGNDGR